MLARRIVGRVVVYYLVFCLVFGICLGEMAFRIQRLPVADPQSFQAAAARFGAALQDVSVTASDSVVLRAWFARPATANGDAVILLHGIGDDRQGMTGFAELFLSKGYEVLLLDLRAHGNTIPTIQLAAGRVAYTDIGSRPSMSAKATQSDTTKPVQDGVYAPVANVGFCRSKLHTLLQFLRSSARRGLHLFCVTAFILSAATFLLMLLGVGVAFCFGVFFLAVHDQITGKEGTLITILSAWRDPDGSTCPDIQNTRKPEDI